MAQRIGIFGGTFDPIHFGHLRIAEEARDRFALDTVLFVPNQVSPFKIGETVTPAALRAELARAAIFDNPAFALWTGELDRPGASYTVETLRAISADFPHSERYFLTGTDAVRDIGKWREPEECLALAHFVAFHRPGVTESEAREGIPDHLEPGIVFVPMNGLDISSTEIRQRVQQGRSIRYLLPEAAITIIQENQLYRMIE